MNQNLPLFAANTTEEVIDLMLKHEKSFNPKIYCDLIIYNILASIAFGKRFV